MDNAIKVWSFIIETGKRNVLVLIALSLTLNILTLAQPIYMLSLYDRVLSSQSLHTLFVLTVITLLVLIAYGLFDWHRNRVQRDLAHELYLELRNRTLYSELKLYLYKGGAKSQILANPKELKHFFESPSFISIFDALFIPIYFVLLWFFHPVIFLVCLILTGLIFIIAILTDKGQEKGLKAYWANKKKIEAIEHEALRMSAQHYPLGRLRGDAKEICDKQDRLYAEQLDSQGIFGLSESLSKSIMMVSQTVILAVTCYFVVTREVSVGVLFAVNIVAIRAMQPIYKLTSTLKSVSKARAAWDEISEAVSGRKGASAGNDSSGIKLNLAKIRVRSLTVLSRSEDKKIIQNIGFDLDPSEFLVICGEPGSGKSTLIKALAGLVPDYIGTIDIKDRPVKHWEFMRPDGYIGYLSESPDFPKRSIRYVLTGEENGSLDSALPILDRLRIKESIESLKNEYESILDPATPLLSEQEMRLLGLARAVYGSPKLLLIDEQPLDTKSEHFLTLTAFLNDYRREGCAVIWVSNSKKAMDAADKILWMKMGQVKSYGLAEDVLPKLFPTMK